MPKVQNANHGLPQSSSSSESRGLLVYGKIQSALCRSPAPSLPHQIHRRSQPCEHEEDFQSAQQHACNLHQQRSGAGRRPGQSDGQTHRAQRGRELKHAAGQRRPLRDTKQQRARCKQQQIQRHKARRGAQRGGVHRQPALRAGDGWCAHLVLRGDARTQLRKRRLQRDERPRELDAARRRARAAADEHHQNHDANRRLRPILVAHGRVARSRERGDDVKQRLTQPLAQAHIQSRHQHQRRDGHKDGQQNTEKAKLAAPEGVPPFPPDEEQQDGEVGRAHQHEEDGDALDGDAVIRADALRLIGEAAGRERAHRVQHRVKRRHPAQ